jgi:hypothetical protein
MARWPGCRRGIRDVRCLQASSGGRHGAVCVGRAERGSLSPLPRSWVRPVPGSTPLSSVMGAAGSSLSLGEAGIGVWGKTWNRAVVLRGRGGSGCSPSAFPDWSPLLSVYSCSRAVVFLTSLSLLCEGVRSGTRRRRGASASAQAGGGTGPETRRTAPARAGAVLSGRYTVAVRPMSRSGEGSYKLLRRFIYR